MALIVGQEYVSLGFTVNNPLVVTVDEPVYGLQIRVRAVAYDSKDHPVNGPWSEPSESYTCPETPGQPSQPWVVAVVAAVIAILFLISLLSGKAGKT